MGQAVKWAWAWIKAGARGARLYFWPPIHEDVPAADRKIAQAAGASGIALGVVCAAVLIGLVIWG